MPATAAATVEKIKIFGQVRGFDFKPIMTIKVTIYNDQEELNHVFTDAQGRYSVAGPAGQALTIRFDTHHLSKARQPRLTHWLPTSSRRCGVPTGTTPSPQVPGWDR